MRLRAAALLLPLLLAAGCTSYPPYWRSRAADLGDAIPISSDRGAGLFDVERSVPRRATNQRATSRFYCTFEWI